MTSQIPKYKTFEDWFYETENFGLRAERFWESTEQFLNDNGKLANVELWLRAAFDAAKLEN